MQDFFAYQGVYQRHLMRHRAKDEISEPDMALVVEGSLRLAEELARIEQEKSLREAVSVGELHIDDTGDLIKFLNARKSEGISSIRAESPAKSTMRAIVSYRELHDLKQAMMTSETSVTTRLAKRTAEVPVRLAT